MGIIVALPAEAKSLGARNGQAGDTFSVEGGSVVICGIGPARAAAAAKRFVAGGARGLLSWGTAGGLAPALRPGDIMIPERILTCANGDVASTDAAWHGQVTKELAARVPITSGTLWSSREPVVSVAQKQALAERNLAATDMESGAIAAVAARAGLPFLAIKAICDPAGRAVPAAVTGLLDADGRFNPPGLIGMLRGGFPAWRAAAALSQDFAAALRALAIAAEALPAIAGYTRVP